MNINRNELIRVVDLIRKTKCCCYRSRSFCDCKFGVGEVLLEDEISNGCPELFVVIHLLNKMTDEEYKNYIESM